MDVTFVVNGWYGPVPFLTCTVPELEANVKGVDFLILECEIIADSGWDIFAKLVLGKHSDEGCFSDSATANKTDFNEFINFGVLLLN